ncbi:DUF7715 family protein [Modestobacter lapidis]|nr:hypothetical protein [Modestobacter lapidis]
MKLLTATRETQGERPGDFCRTVDGELVLLGFVCATDEKNPDGGCGCGRAFSGMSSLQPTTTAKVLDLDLTVDDVRLAVEAHLIAAGTGPDVLGDAEFVEYREETLEDTLFFAQPWAVGTVVGRRLDHVHRRT